MNIKKEPEEEPTMEFKSMKCEIGSQCGEKNIENAFKIKIEKIDSEELTSSMEQLSPQKNIKMLPVFKSDPSSNSTPYFGIQIDEIHVKNELVASKEVCISDTLDFTDVHDFCLSHPLLGLVAKITLKRVHFYRRNFVCDVCFEIFPTLAIQEMHKAIHKSSVSCKLMLKSTDQHISRQIKSVEQRSNFDVQNENKDGLSVKKSLKCEDCDFVCQHQWKLRSHKMLHLKEKPFKCDKCGYSCIYFSDMKKHKMIHSGEKPYKCEVCEYSCFFVGDIKKHKMIHTGEKPFNCDECSFSCSISSYMKKHKMTHSGEKPFKCDKCDYSCIHSTYMKRHKTIHSGEKPFKCDQCSFSCIYPSYLKKHKMIHSGEKPFICDRCDYSCIQSCTMKAHNMIHSTKKPFKCDKCEYSCKQYRGLKKHKEIHSANKS